MSFSTAEKLAFKPPEEISVSEWAERHRVLSRHAAIKGPYRLSFVPFFVPIMDACKSWDINEIVVQKPAQIGEPLSLETPIPTPDGWTTMGDIAIGDLVFDESGEICEVIFVSETWEKRKCWNIIFSDGSEIVCDSSHLWSVTNEKDYKRKKHQTLTAEEISKTFRHKNRNIYAIPVADPLALPPKDFTISPYALGVWLGDGSNANCQITMHEDDADKLCGYIIASGHNAIVRKPPWVKGNCKIISIEPASSNDPDVCIRGHLLSEVGTYKIKKTGSTSCAECRRQQSKHFQYGGAVDPVLRTGFYTKLSRLNLIKNKHIPQEYLRGSYQQRIELLRGLMDTDGYVSQKGHCEITIADEQLHKDVYELLISLGLKPTVRKRRCFKTGFGTSIKNPQIHYRISFLAYSDQQIFKLSRKLRNMRSADNSRVSETKRRRIVDVRETDSVPVKCIGVNSKSNLFLAGRSMIPTHNTDAFVNVIGYYFDQEPSSIMMVMADEDTANYVCTEKITAMFLDSPYMHQAYYNPNTFARTEIKAENGAYLAIGWASSVSKMGTKPMRIVIFDEINKPGYSLTTREASPLSLGRERTNTYPEGYYKHILLSTPTDEAGNITIELDSCDVVYDWQVPCPECGTFQVLRWSSAAIYTTGFNDGLFRGDDGRMHKIGGVVWEGGRKATKAQVLQARYKCGECGALWNDSQKNEAVRQGKMVPRTEATGNEKKIGFHLNRLYSLFDGGRITKIVKDWIGILKLSGLALQGAVQGFINSTLAEPYKQVVIETSEKKILQARCDLPPQTVPETAVAITCGIDRQKYGFYFVVRAFARDYTSWLIHYGFLPTWTEVEQLLFNTQYPVRNAGASMRIWRAAIDTGGSDYEDDMSLTEDTYWWLVENSIGRGVSIWGTKGSSHPIPGRFKAGAQLRKTPSGKPLPHWFHIILIDTATMKDAYHYALDQAIEGKERAAYLHAETKEDYARQIMAEEKRRSTKGVLEWVRTKPDNHYFDAEILAMSVAHPDWMGGGVNLVGGRMAPRSKPVATEKPKSRPVAKSRWMS
jgi:phage terminase large subunit GpA-like protein